MPRADQAQWAAGVVPSPSSPSLLKGGSSPERFFALLPCVRSGHSGVAAQPDCVC